ncbi:MAG: antitoxin [Clostridiales bacterium]|nr:antitoxin [Clostridiales bacterium]
MADMLKVTTPLINRGQINPTKQVSGPDAPPFNPIDVTRVAQVNDAGSEMLKNYGGMIDKDGKPTILMNLLKDPAVTVSFLKNIYMLEEIIQLIPMNNKAFTEEIQKMFSSLLIKPEDIASEMIKQENQATSFKGDLFDFLRGVIGINPDNDTKLSVATLLKAINHEMNRRDILDAIGNNLNYLGKSLSASRTLSDKILALSEKLRDADADENFNTLKKEVAIVLNEIEGSILYNSKISKLASITEYNLSRFNDNTDFLNQSVRNLLVMLDGNQSKNELINLVNAFMRDIKSGNMNALKNSETMDIIADIINKQDENKEIRMLNSENIDKIVYSLLSSPCNFTPLLHFIIPVNYFGLKSFAEVWIDPDGSPDENRGKSGDNKCIHMLIVFDIEGVGQFETELFVEDKKINFNLLCPPSYVETFSKLKEDFIKCISFSEYYFENIKVDKLEKTRSLLEVFKTLPHKRTGVDVKI